MSGAATSSGGERDAQQAPAPLLEPRRAVALVALLAALVLYAAGAGVFPNASEPWDVAVVALVLLPATAGVVCLLLPLARARGLLAVAVALAVLSGLLDVAGVGSVFNLTKLVALALLGFWFLELFQAVSWVVLVAAIVPWVDALSVWRGPTKVVVTQHPSLFDRISIGFRIPGEEATANIGPPDVIFLALFLATAQRFGLRVGWTFAATTALLALTLALTAAFDVGGLPALPAISVGFLLPNADLLWRRYRQRRPQAS